MQSVNQLKTTTEGTTITATAADASADVVYTCPAYYNAEVSYLMVTNSATSNQNISIQFYHEDDTSYHYILKDKAVAGNDNYQLINNNILYLHAGDKIVAYKGGGTFDVVISAKEVYIPNRG